ncbi:MAG: phytanoyl-CoA dioxygenase family protein [Oculatellaceae cyanobacterium Prado106]|nr:phytanoyl-CoA dioxygenase family protein [Oculatellaceae cyanobacterium Prado106]
MMNVIANKFAELPAEFAYRAERAKHLRNLPPLKAQEQQWLDALEQEGACITSLEELGFDSGDRLLTTAQKYLKQMDAIAAATANQLPQIFTVTDLPEFYNWGSEPRLLNLIEHYIGLPIAFHGVHLRKDFAGDKPTPTQNWHLDAEDRRILKAIVYLNDVTEQTGPFEYIPKSLTAPYQPAFWKIYWQNKQRGFLGVENEAIAKILPRSAWKLCPGKKGTVILVDTRQVFHHGTLRTEDRSALFFVYTAKHPQHPELCTQYHDHTFARPAGVGSGEWGVGSREWGVDG